MRLHLLGLMLLGFLAALSAAVLVGSMQREGDTDAEAAAGGRRITVFTAARDLPATTKIREDMLADQTVPEGSAPAGGFRDRTQLLGRVLVKSMVKGETFKPSCFAEGGPGVGLTGELEPGMRAMTISLPDYAGMEGLLYPGAVVDVLASFRLNRRLSGEGVDGEALSTTLLRRVKILAIETETVGGEKAKEESTLGQARSAGQKHKVTLMLAPEQAKSLQLAMEYGEVSLALRSPLDDQDTPIEDPTLLSGGRLAGLASLMKATDRGPDTDRPGSGSATEVTAEEEPASETPEQESDPEESRTLNWNVQILRGVQSETRSFELPRSEAAPGGSRASDKETADGREVTTDMQANR